jgi:hypothetical protein
VSYVTKHSAGDPRYQYAVATGAGMTASRLNHRGHVIPALTDHLEDKGGVIGLGIVRLKAKDRQSSHNPNFHIGDDRCSDATGFPQKDSFVLLFVREIARMPPRASCCMTVSKKNNV